MIGIRDHAQVEVSQKEDGTLAAVLHDLLQKRFPEQSANELFSRMSDDPKGFETGLQARLGFLQCGGTQ